jgi:hypothetical protein
LVRGKAYIPGGEGEGELGGGVRHTVQHEGEDAAGERIRMRFRNNTDLNRIRTIGPRTGKSYVPCGEGEGELGGGVRNPIKHEGEDAAGKRPHRRQRLQQDRLPLRHPGLNTT